jgi:hypothetical protein
MNFSLGGGRIFSHFTNAGGIKGITGIDAESLKVGQRLTEQEMVRTLRV